MRRASIALGVLAAALLHAPATAAVRNGLELTPTAVGGVDVGGPAPAVRKVLRRALGAPDRTQLSDGCELNPDAEPRRHLTWGALTVTTAPARKRLVGWTVGAGRLPAGVRLPHGVTTATTVREAMDRIPHAAGRWDDVFQKYWITTPDEPPMMWAGDRRDGAGRVTYITNAFEPCE